MVRYVLVFLQNLIARNIVKCLLLTATIIIFKYAGSLPDTKVSIKVISTLVDPSDTNNHLYLSKYIVNGSIKYVVAKLDTGQLINKEGNLVYYENNNFNILLWACFGSLLLLVVLLPDVDWDIGNCLKEAFYSTIYCEIEDGKFVYMTFGRLLCKSDKQIYNNYYGQDLCFSDILKYPKYQTKSSKRDSLLDKILK